MSSTAPAAAFAAPNMVSTVNASVPNNDLIASSAGSWRCFRGIRRVDVANQVLEFAARAGRDRVVITEPDREVLTGRSPNPSSELGLDVRRERPPRHQPDLELVQGPLDDLELPQISELPEAETP